MNSLTIKNKSDNIVAISDLHVDEWLYYNPEPGYRLSQYAKLAERLIEVSTEYNSNVLLILGDLINKARTSPLVLHTLNHFLKLLVPYYDIYFILGQHDMTAKVADPAPQVSFVTLMTDIDPKIHYCHRTTLDINGYKLHMMNWIPNDVVQFPDCDVALGHVSLGFGQEPVGNYKLGVFGDIHTPVDYGINHSCSTPFQHHPSEYEFGCIGIIDLSTMEFKRIPSDTEKYKFLKLRETDQYISAVSTVSQVQSEDEKLRLQLTNSIYDEILKIVTEKGYFSIYNEIDLVNAPTPISFDFKLIKLQINNFRSIETYELDFNSWDKVLFISGKNGSGKSSILNALITALLGDRQIGINNRKLPNGDFLGCEVTVSLSYNNSIYDITRGPGYTILYSDGVQVTKNSKRDLDNYIYEVLPFLHYLYYFICKPNSHFFDSVDRTELIKVCFNLGIFDYIYEQSLVLLSGKNEEVLDIESDINITQAVIDNEVTQIAKYRSDLALLVKPDVDVETLSTQVRYLTESSSKLASDYTKIESLKTTRADLVDRVGGLNKFDVNILTSELELVRNISKLEADINELNNKISTNNKNINLTQSSINTLVVSNQTCPNCGEIFNNSQDKINELNTKLVELNNTIIQDTNKLNEITAKLYELNQIPKMFTRTFEYENKINEINNIQELLNKINNIDNEINESTNKYMELYGNVQNLLQGVTSSEFMTNATTKIKEYSEYNKLEELCKSLELKLTQDNEKLSSLKAKLEFAKTDTDSYYEFSELFNPNNLSSIPFSVIDSILQSMTNEDIRFNSTRELASGESRFSVSVDIKVSDTWINYDAASDGQKVILDLFILNKVMNLLGNCGLLILDESLGNLDEVNHNVALKFFDDTNVKKILITSHNPLFEGADARLSCELIDGVTAYNFS